VEKVQFVDQTIRDAQQSLWGNMMRTDYITPIAEVMDRVGYLAVATVGSQAFTVQVRNLDENPWERVRALSTLMPSTCLRGSYQTASLSSFDMSTPRDVISLWIKRSVANGIRGFWICDYQENMERFRYFAGIARAEGAEIVTSLMYTTSPLHTSEHWIAKARLIAEAGDCIDRIMISDESGIITPEGTREIISIVQHNCEGIPLEFHCHCNSGLAPLCYIEAVRCGVTTLHTAVAPLANGTSLPATESVLRNLRRLGYECDLDEDALAVVSAHFREVAAREGLQTGAPVEYDVFHLQHQVPGGMVTNFTRQLRELGAEERLEEILEEAVQVRRDYGYPVMATPYSQIVGAQAFDNVISGERYKNITDESIKYLLGYYGEGAYPLDADLMEKVEALPRTKEFREWRPEGYLKSVDELRQEVGPALSDDELLLKILIPGRPIKPNAKAQEGMPATDTIAPEGASSTPSIGVASTATGFPRVYSVDVDGEVFTVRIAPLREDVASTAPPDPDSTAADDSGAAVARGEEIGDRKREVPEGAVLCGIPGLILALTLKAGDEVAEGEEIAVIESMKMRRSILASRGGVVREIMVGEGQMVAADDVLMVVV